MIRRLAITAVCFLAAHLPYRSLAHAQESDDPGPINLKSPTMGGRQFWVDQLVFHGWRIQRNVMTDHCRLLDQADVRHAWGTREQCDEKLEAIRRQRNLTPMGGKAVVLLHGLFRSRSSMDGLARYLETQGGYTVASFGYPTTRGAIEDHARDLGRFMQCLTEVEEINFVGHSLGNLVLRHYLGDCTDVASQCQPDPRIKRIVMLAPPNLGAETAQMLVPLDWSGQISGKAAGQLARHFDQLAPKLAVPACEFGILAGGRGDKRGYNPFLPGDDDLVVTVASTRLPGARDFRLVPAIHSRFMNDARVQGYVLKFLQQGCFETAEQCAPIIEELP